MQQYKTKPYYN